MNVPGIPIPFKGFDFFIVEDDTVDHHWLLKVQLHHFFGSAAKHIKSDLVPSANGLLTDIRCNMQIVMHHIPPASFTVQAATERILPAEFLFILQKLTAGIPW